MSKPLKIVHHAVLYALVCRAACEQLGPEEGEALMERVTFRYGCRRGRRMADNAETHGDSRDLTGYFLYGELSSDPGENLSVLTFEPDQTTSRVERCAWAEAWKQYGLFEYGKIYCRQVDAGLCEGYDGGFCLTLDKTMGKGDNYCLFQWSEGLTAQQQKFLEHKKALLGKSIQRSYLFHCKELLQVAEETMENSGVSWRPIEEQVRKDWEALFPDYAFPD